jgi:hypothetical protein
VISTTNFIKARGPVCYRVGKTTERVDSASMSFLNPPNVSQRSELLKVAVDERIIGRHGERHAAGDRRAVSRAAKKPDVVDHARKLWLTLPRWLSRSRNFW